MHADPTAKIEIHLHFPPGFAQNGQAPEHLHVYLGMPPVLGPVLAAAPAAAIEPPSAATRSGGWLRSAVIALVVGLSAATITSYISRPHPAAGDPSAPFRPMTGQAAGSLAAPGQAASLPPALLQQLATAPHVTAPPGSPASSGEPDGPEAFGLHR